jgi:hypothetical protein
VLIKSRERAPAVAAVRAVIEDAAATRRLRELALAVDVDPQ